MIKLTTHLDRLAVHDAAKIPKIAIMHIGRVQGFVGLTLKLFDTCKDTMIVILAVRSIPMQPRSEETSAMIASTTLSTSFWPLSSSDV